MRIVEQFAGRSINLALSKRRDKTHGRTLVFLKKSKPMMMLKGRSNDFMKVMEISTCKNMGKNQAKSFIQFQGHF
jgi:hypothetical protein